MQLYNVTLIISRNSLKLFINFIHNYFENKSRFNKDKIISSIIFTKLLFQVKKIHDVIIV